MEEVGELQKARRAVIETRSTLQLTVIKHRKKAHITCPDDCWCWDAVNFINSTLWMEAVSTIKLLKESE